MDFKLEIKGLTEAKLDKHIRKTHPKIVKQSQIAALNQTTTTIRARAARGISAQAKIRPIKLIKQRTRRFKANKNRVASGVYLDHSSIPAEILSGPTGPRWTRRMKGVRVKSRFYEGAFVGIPRVGKNAGKRQRVYRRVSNTGENRRDLRAQYIKLDPYKGILTTVGDRVVKAKLERAFISQFKYRLKKAGF